MFLDADVGVGRHLDHGEKQGLFKLGDGNLFTCRGVGVKDSLGYRRA
jgi:hypothetical protein